jgi:hypothetical protein
MVNILWSIERKEPVTAMATSKVSKAPVSTELRLRGVEILTGPKVRLTLATEVRNL